METEVKNVQTWECGAENAADVIASLDNHILTIAGKGAMKNYDRDKNKAPWHGSAITKVEIKQGITSIGNSSFLNCYGLTSISIPDSVTIISWSAFSGCSALTFINIPENVTKIEYYAFEGCSSLTSINIPEKVTSIGQGSFINCFALASVNISASVTCIGPETFFNCSSLTSIIIPENVINIGYNAFRGCKSLTNLTNLNPVPQHIPSNTFHPDEIKNITLYLPSSAINSYRNAPVWKNLHFKAILPIPTEAPTGEGTKEQLESEIARKREAIELKRSEISRLEKEISEDNEEISKLQNKILCMRGLKDNPKDFAQFMSLFNQRDGLKYLTHDFDETGRFDMESFLAQARKLIAENDLEIPKSILELLTQFAFEAKPQWTTLDKEYNPKKVENGWSALDSEKSKANGLHPIKVFPEFAGILKDFKRTTRIESPNLDTLINKVFNDKTFEIEQKDLSKADFYTHVGEFKLALETIFKEIQQRGNTPDKKKVSVAYEREVSNDNNLLARNIVITHHNSYPTRDNEDLINEWLALEKGSMGKTAKLLQGYFHWSVITNINDKPVKINILREKDTPKYEEIEASKVKGFTHILTFYVYQP
jgi:hypothetical protein